MTITLHPRARQAMLRQQVRRSLVHRSEEVVQAAQDVAVTLLEQGHSSHRAHIHALNWSDSANESGGGPRPAA